MAESRRPRSVSAALVLDLLTDRFGPSAALRGASTPELRVVDVGGGTGAVAITLAELGHRVTVVDPSPDALASLQRRIEERGLTGRVRGVQGDATDLPAVVGNQLVDVVICHRVLEVVDSPGEALDLIAGVLRPGGVLSLLVSSRHGAVLTSALAGHLGAARRVWADPTRFDLEAVLALVSRTGLVVSAVNGIGAVADHVTEALTDADPVAYRELYALEAEISRDPAFCAVAPSLHVFAERPRH